MNAANNLPPELAVIRDRAIAANTAAIAAEDEGLSLPGGWVPLTVVARRMGLTVADLTGAFIRARLDLNDERTAMRTRRGPPAGFHRRR